MSNSTSGYNNSQIEEDALAVAFGQAVLVAAAGNDGITNEAACLGKPMYPAAHNWIIGVMAGKTSGGLASFSNIECIPHNRFEYEIILPGVDIMSTLPGDQYAAWDGTSMAAPVASGMAVLLRSKWADKDVYSSRFIMGQLVANNGNLLAAMTKAPEPELRYLEHWLFDREQEAVGNDGDGIVDNGETVELAIVIRNHWGKAGNVTLKLEAQASGAFQPDPYVTFEIDEVNLGAVGSFNWDDNGLIYDDEGLITGVRTPLRFSVASNTPNDHLIPFKLTMTCENGYEPDDPNAPYVFESRFTLVVQNGRTLPRVIEEDMTLTNEHFWIVPDQTFIEQGAILTVKEKTQIQFGSADPNDVYSENPNPFILANGNLLALGTLDNPIEMFPSASLVSESQRVEINGTMFKPFTSAALFDSVDKALRE